MICCPIKILMGEMRVLENRHQNWGQVRARQSEIRKWWKVELNVFKSSCTNPVFSICLQCVFSKDILVSAVALQK